MKKIALVILASLTPLLPVFTPAFSETARDKEEIIRSRPANGMRAVLLEDHAAPVTAFHVWVGVGSAKNRPSEAGISHLIEHMIFKGTNKRRSGEIAGSIEGYGSISIPIPAMSATLYHVVITSRYQDKGLQVLADDIQYPAFDPQELTWEKDVVVEEIRMGEDNPGKRSINPFSETAFSVTPMGGPLLDMWPRQEDSAGRGSLTIIERGVARRTWSLWGSVIFELRRHGLQPLNCAVFKPKELLTIVELNISKMYEIEALIEVLVRKWIVR